MKPIESRKTHLIAESEHNRNQLLAEMFALTSGVRALADRAKSFGLIASSATLLATGLAVFRRVKSPDAGAKPSWRQTLLRWAGQISALWLTLRTQRRDREQEVRYLKDNQTNHTRG